MERFPGPPLLTTFHVCGGRSNVVSRIVAEAFRDEFGKRAGRWVDRPMDRMFFGHVTPRLTCASACAADAARVLLGWPGETGTFLDEALSDEGAL